MECVANNVVSPLYVALGEEGEEGKERRKLRNSGAFHLDRGFIPSPSGLGSRGRIVKRRNCGFQPLLRPVY